MFGIYLRHKGPVATNSRTFGPLDASAWMVMEETRVPCVACGEYFKIGDYAILVPVGADDDDNRRKCVAGGWYSAVALPVHAPCAGVDPKVPRPPVVDPDAKDV